jgi:ABC-type transport system substrate-binding protein
MEIGCHIANVTEADETDFFRHEPLHYAVNKQEIIEQLFRGIGAAELTAPLPLTVAERNPKLKGYPYDPAKAERLLKEARAIGKTITLEAPSNRYTLDREIGEAIAG